MSMKELAARLASRPTGSQRALANLGGRSARELQVIGHLGGSLSAKDPLSEAARIVDTFKKQHPRSWASWLSSFPPHVVALSIASHSLGLR